jgi:PleD family two-component response regulator
VYGIVNGYRGACEIDSAVGRGTRVEIHLPALPAAATVKPERRATIVRGSGGILTVDDEWAVRDVMERSLRRLGYQVWTAANGREATEIPREHGDRIDLVLLDINMPVMGGIEAY